MPTWVLTGANRGLGLEFVRQLSASAENSVFAGIRSTGADHAELASLAKSATGRVHVLQCDAAEQKSVLAFAENITEILRSDGKEGKVDFLLNNAGINANGDVTVLSPTEGKDGSKVPVTDITSAMLSSHMDTNVLGPLTLAAALDPLLGDGSVVVNMTSGLGSLVKTKEMQPRKCAVYSLSKAAVNMLTLHLDGEWRARGKGVVCVAMDPGWVKTRMGGEGAVLEADVSIAGMLRVFRGLGREDGGRFFSYEGVGIPW